MMYLYPGLSSSYMVLWHLEWLLIVCSIFLLSITFRCLVLILSKGLFTPVYSSDHQLCRMMSGVLAGRAVGCQRMERK